MSQKRKEPGAVKIEKLNLMTPSGSVNLVPMVTRLDLYENIMSPFIVCELYAADGISFIDSFPGITEMSIDIQFTSDETQAPIKHTLAVYNIVNKTTSVGDKIQTFKIICVSEDFDKPEAKEVLQYSYNNTCAFHVADLLQNKIKTTKEGYFEQTDGIIPTSSLSNKTPYQLIEYFRDLALSPKYQSHSYVFYQDKYGYKFVTIEKLIEEGKKKIGDRVFQYNEMSPQTMDLKLSGWRSVLARINVVDNFAKWEEWIGGNNPRAVELNMLQGSIEQVENEEYNFVRMDDSGAAPKTSARVEKSKQRKTENLFFVKRDDDDIVATKKYLALKKFLPELLSIVSHIEIYGDSTMTVGEMIKLEIPNIDGLTKRKTELSPTYSGNYLILKMRHMIDMAGPPFYTQALEVCKSGVAKG